MVISSFPPIADARPRVLILGTMPSVVSLAKQQYYGHAQNAFWPILFALWAQENDISYEARRAFAITHEIAIWDVAYQCEREGSSDQAISAVVPNDVVGLLQSHDTIHHVFLNGGTAQRLYKRFCGDVTLPAVLLPSTSPAYTLPFAQKLNGWRVVREAVEKHHL